MHQIREKNDHHGDVIQKQIGLKTITPKCMTLAVYIWWFECDRPGWAKQLIPVCMCDTHEYISAPHTFNSRKEYKLPYYKTQGRHTLTVTYRLHACWVKVLSKLSRAKKEFLRLLFCRLFVHFLTPNSDRTCRKLSWRGYKFKTFPCWDITWSCFCSRCRCSNTRWYPLYRTWCQWRSPLRCRIIRAVPCWKLW